MSTMDLRTLIDDVLRHVSSMCLDNGEERAAVAAALVAAITERERLLARPRRNSAVDIYEGRFVIDENGVKHLPGSPDYDRIVAEIAGKVSTKYVCELCDTEYDTPEELDDCVQAHIDEQEANR